MKPLLRKAGRGKAQFEGAQMAKPKTHSQTGKAKQEAAKAPSPEKPGPAEIIAIEQDTLDTKTFTVRYLDKELQKSFRFVPGKFMMVSIFGFGEMPISISSSPYKTDSMKFTVVNVGNVTNAMHSLKKGAVIGLRGPFGNGFPLQKMRKKNIVFVGGGCGLAPLRSAIYAVQEKKSEFGNVFVLSGCRAPENALFSGEKEQWKSDGFNVLSTVDKAESEWKGNIGLVTSLFPKIDLPAENTVVLLCGPPVMVHFALIELAKKGFKEGQIFASMERMMQCGMGYCSHCNIGGKYVCKDGPVFSAKELKSLPVKED
jgi:NAD(P)H-flavin reductase